MAGCRIVNEGVSSAVEAINGYATSYRTAGETLITSLSSAIADMEGAAKDAFKTLIDGDINNFVATDLPGAIEGMASLLEANRDNFEKVDSDGIISVIDATSIQKYIVGLNDCGKVGQQFVTE